MPLHSASASGSHALINLLVVLVNGRERVLQLTLQGGALIAGGVVFLHAKVRLSWRRR